MIKENFVSVIVPTYNRFDLFLNCVKSLSVQNFDKEMFEVIAVHDGLECDYDENKIRKFSKGIKNFQFKKICHGGAAQVRNYAISISRGELVLMIDDDCQAKSNWISSLVQYMKNNKSVVGIGGTVLATRPQTFVQKYIAFKNLLRRPIRDINENIIAIITANACFRRSILDEVEMFSKEFTNYGYGGEDLDLSFKCRKIGELAYCENAIVYHDHRRSLKNLIKQHISYGKGTYLACKLNGIDINFKLLKFYEPTFFNWFKYLGYLLKRIFSVLLPEFREKNLKLHLYIPYLFLDTVRKMSFMIGVTIEYYKK